MAAPVIQPSFANGELSPKLYGRIDLQKYHSAAALIRNFFVDYRGGVSNRAGSMFVGPCSTPAPNRSSLPRLIPFLFSTIQAYALEFGNGYIQFIKDGAYVLESATVRNISAITQANPGVVTTSAPHGLTTGDKVYLTGIGGMVQLNGRTVQVIVTGASTFTMVDLLTNVAINTTGYTAYTSGGTETKIYIISTPYVGSDIRLLKFTQSADVMTLTHPSYAPRELTRTADDAWTLTTITFAAQLSPPGGIVLTPSTVGSVYYAYRVTAVTEDGNESVASDLVGTLSLDITTTANHIQISWTSVAGAKFYNVYKATPVKNAVSPTSSSPPVPTLFGFMITTEALLVSDTYIDPDYAQTPPLARDPVSPGQLISVNLTAGGAGFTSKPTVAVTGGGGSGAIVEALLNGGSVVGFIIINPGRNYTSAPTITISGGGGAGATATATIGPTTGTYPGTCGYLQQRRTFAGSTNQPKAFWMSQPGLHYNFNISNPLRADDAITGALDSLQVNAIQHLVPMTGSIGAASSLLAFTTGSIWQISGGGQADPITPQSAQGVPQANSGVNIYLAPLVINESILYAPYTGLVVRELNYNVRTNIYGGTEISTLSNHLFTSYEIISWAYADAPNKLAWCVRSDGAMLTLAFLKEQEVIGWAHSDTNGRYVSVCTIPENGIDAVYFIVERLINGNFVYYAERAASREIDNDIQNSWFLDCALSNDSGSNVSLPAATMQPTAASGTGVIFVQSSAVITAGHVGHQIRAGSGVATITAVNALNITCNIVQPFATIPNEVGDFPVLWLSGEWELWAPVTTVSGLWHLEGTTVRVFADGNDLGTRTVTNGAVALNGTYFRVVVGLSYISQMQTLYLDTNNPTIQGKRKQAYGMTTRVAESTGFSVGDTFDTLQPWNPNVQNFQGTQQNGLRTGDYRRNIAGGWTILGQQCIEQDAPLPVSVLAVIPEITIGDSPG